MYKNIVEYYTWSILKKQLQKFKISNNALYNILEDVKSHLNSIIYNWNDKEFRDAILIIGSEEGIFYEPKNDMIANMVVVAIRNSLLEGVSSSYYKEYGSLVMLEDKNIKFITGEAINYFSKFDLNIEAGKIKLDTDFYRDISNKYPRAIEALKQLAKCNEKNLEHDYSKVEGLPYEIEEMKAGNIEIDKKIRVVESGIDISINEDLMNYLSFIKNTDSKIFITDCFKMLTRNFEKLLKVLEFVISNDGIFVTKNYLIAKDYVSRRKELVKASHSLQEFNCTAQTLLGLTQNEKYLLELKKYIQ